MILDLRDSDQVEPLLHGVAVKLAADDVPAALVDATKWSATSKGCSQPSPHHALVFISEAKVRLNSSGKGNCGVHTNHPHINPCLPAAWLFKEYAIGGTALYVLRVVQVLQAKLHAATGSASLHGFHTCFTVMAKRPLEQPHGEPPEPWLISNDALAHVMNIRGASGDSKPPVLVDVRRHDERTLFGCITGSVHVPAEDLAVALQSTHEVFEQIARTPAWHKEDTLVFHSRSTCRAQWAAILAKQQGADFDDVLHCVVAMWVLCWLIKLRACERGLDLLVMQVLRMCLCFWGARTSGIFSHQCCDTRTMKLVTPFQLPHLHQFAVSNLTKLQKNY